MARSSAAMTALRAQLDSAEQQVERAKAAAAKARGAAADAAEVWPELAGAAVAGGLAGAGVGYSYEVMGVELPIVPLAGGIALMLGTKRGGMAARAGRGMLIAASYDIAAQLTSGGV